MRNPALSAKITRPAIPGVFPREKLFRLLDSMRGCPAIWVSAPAGSGKTTLIASYLESRKVSNLWYQVDQTDKDPASFFYYIGMAARKSGRSRKPMPLFTAEYLQGFPAFTARYFEGLYQRLKPPHILVFDNCQEAIDAPSFEEILVQAIPLVPEGTNCVFISRHEPPPRLVRLLANRKMGAMDWEEISFSLAETEMFINAYGKKRVPKETLQELHEKTRGWAAGLVLLLEEMKRAGSAPGRLDDIRPERIFDYFASEVLSKMDAVTGEFLMKASFLPRIPARSAEKLTGIEAAEKILSGLSRSNYFIDRRVAGPPVYQMHPLFREFLNDKALQTYSNDELEAVKKKAAALLEEAGQIEDAAELWIDSKDWAALSGIILKNAEQFVNQGRTQTLEGWISKIPGEILEGSPWLLFWRGMCRMGFDHGQARGHFEKAFQGFTAGSDMAGALLSWSFIVDCIVLGWDDFSPMGGWIDRLYALMETKAGFYFPFRGIEDRINARVAACMASALISVRPTHPDAEMWVERTLALSRDCGDPACRIHALGHAFYFYGSRGETSKALQVSGEILAAAEARNVPPFLKVFSMQIRARGDIFITHDVENALAGIYAIRELCDRTGIQVWNVDLAMLGAMAALMAGDFEMADRFLHEKNWLELRQKVGRCQFMNVLVNREFLVGNFAMAEAHAEAYYKESENIGFIWPIALSRFELAQVKHALHKFEEAQKYIRSFGEVSAGVKVFKFMCLFAQAQFALDRGQEAAALEYLREGFCLGREQNYLCMHWWWDPVAMARLCAKALEAGIEPEYARGLVRKWDLTQYISPVEIEDWPWPVKIHTFGEFRIFRDGRALEFNGKAQQKPLGLLKSLISLGRKDIPEETITDILWPEAEGDLGHKSFGITCLRLRKIIGDRAVRVSGGLCTLDEKYCWTDLQAILRVMERAEGEWQKARGRSGGFEPALSLTEKAAALHKGDFLPAELWQAWAVTVREQVKHRLLRLIMEAGKYLQKTGQWEAAAQKFEMGLELDNLVEELYQDLMRSQISLGRRAQAARTYERCRKALSETLGIAPSAETEKIYKSIF